ncbi:MAG: GNAT family N-acetyltransferase [Actinobacteria bacterium]|nr:GNAT family N-acetyltransferase [Actinomycetota bacterium]
MAEAAGSPADDHSVVLTRVGLEEVSEELLADLESLYSQAFQSSRMHQMLREDVAAEPAIFQLFIVRAGPSILGARVIESKVHPGFDYMGEPPVHGKRFCVSPAARGSGIGKLLIAAGKTYCFDELGVRVIFGESNEIGALALHGREGALYSLASIEERSRRNDSAENVSFFREFLVNPKFRQYRFPCGGGVRFAYCADDDIAATFRDARYLSYAQLLRAA